MFPSYVKQVIMKKKKKDYYAVPEHLYKYLGRYLGRLNITYHVGTLEAT